MALALLMVFVISVAMTTGFILGRVWQMRHDLEQQLEARFAVPDENGKLIPTARRASHRSAPAISSVDQRLWFPGRNRRFQDFICLIVTKKLQSKTIG